MEAQRSTRHRSLGVDRNPQPTHHRVKRPTIGERHKSAPIAARKLPGQVQPMTSVAESRKPIATKPSDQGTDAAGARESCPIINLVVLGNARVGKTTFIRNALNLSKNTSSAVLFLSQMRINATDCRVQLCEIELDDVDLSDNHLLRWPSAIGNVAFPSVDGVLCLYDITDEDSIVGVPQVLYALTKSKLPVVLVACKADAPISEQEIGITFVERIRRSFPLVSFGESSSASAESAQECLNTALKATSSINQLNAAVADASDDDDYPKLMTINTTNFDHLYTQSPESQTPVSESDTSYESQPAKSRPKFAAQETPESYHHNNMVRAITEAMNESKSAEESSTEGGDESTSGNSDQLEISMRKSSLPEPLQSEGGEGGTPFSELVSRLLKKPATKNDTKFAPAFLCLYRSFATPKRLLAAIIERFKHMDESDLVPLIKMAELLRYLQVLAQWTANYPGDFAGSPTRRLAMSFAQDLEQNRSFEPTAREIIGNLLTIIMDDDRDWAYDDHEEYSAIESRRTTRSSIIGDMRKDGSPYLESDNSDNDRDVRRRSIRDSASASTASSILRSSITSSQSASNLFQLDSAREQSKLLKSIPHVPLTKVQWRQFMAIPNEELAREITRMDWTMYSAIRARDFVRHVSLSSQRRARAKHSDTIGMMVKHFNHLALFVSSLILLRDKPKHRARILEKLMDLAWKVRQLNNYNSLGAIVAGIAGPEIARLTQTHELVPYETRRQFMRLTVLMSTSRSYAAYRMAWENSFTERIPYIPLLRQDLTMAATANSTFIGNNINWKKFEIMGDVIVGIQRSHEQPYTLSERTPKSQEITRLILETKVIDDAEDSEDPRSELYDRSMQLEPNSSADGRKSMVGFGVKRSMSGWFQS